MRRYLLFSLPLVALVVIGISFYLLSQNSSQTSLFHIQKADASLTTLRLKRITSHKVAVVTLPTPTFIKLLTPTPTAKPTPTPIKSGLTPTPTLVKIQAITMPTPTVVQTSSDPIKEYIMQKINDYRATQGLSSVKTDSYTCDFAKVRAQEITTAFNHDEFTTRINNHTLPYPSYHQITENIAMTSHYQDVVTMWINSPGHAENMRQDTPFVCVEKSGNYYAYEGWRP